MDERIPVDLADEWESVPRRIGANTITMTLLPEPVIIIGDDGPHIDWRPPPWPDVLPGVAI